MHTTERRLGLRTPFPKENDQDAGMVEENMSPAPLLQTERVSQHAHVGCTSEAARARSPRPHLEPGLTCMHPRTAART